MTWAGNLSSKAQSWAVLARIEGVGDYSGQYTFCSSTPAYGDASYKELMASLPNILSERAQITGGLPDAGACTLELVDGADLLTQTFRTDRAPTTVLTADVAADDTTISVGSSANLTAGSSVLHLGSEAVAVDYFSSGGYGIFNGSTDYIDYGSNTDLDGATSGTWSAWVYMASLDPGTVFQCRASPSLVGWLLSTTGTGGKLRFEIYSGLSNIQESTGTPLSGATWHHIAAVYASSAVTLYVDGSAVASSTAFGSIPASLPSSSGNLRINEGNWAGRASHLAFWAGTAASAGQIAEIYNSGSPPDLEALPTLAAPTWWVPAESDWVPRVGSGTPTVNGTPTFGTGTPSTTLSVTRGHLGTSALTHKANDPVHLSPTYIAGRRFSVYVAPLVGSTSSDERLVGTYLLESYGLTDDLNTWELSGVSQLRYLDRQAPILPRDAKIAEVTNPDNRGVRWLRLEETEIREVWSDRYVHVKVGSEILKATNSAGAPGATVAPRARRTLLPVERGVFGTEEREIKDSDTVRQVLLAGRDFRVSAGPSPSSSRTSGTWTETTNWVDMVLCVMLSSASEDDGLELTNYRTTGSNWSRSNFSALPVGYGLGIPESLIDWSAWESVRARTLAYTFPYVVYGDKAQSFGDWITEQFLTPLGAFITVESGTVSIVLPRMPASSATATITLGPDEILMRRVGRSQMLPRARVSRDKARAFGELIYEVGPTGIRTTITNERFGRTYGQRGFYGSASQPLKISVPGGDPNRADLFAGRGAALLFRRQRPPMSIDCDASMEAFAATAGDTASITLAEAPNMEDATRGWTSRIAQVMEREVRFEGDREGAPLGAYMRIRAETYGDRVRIGVIAPSAVVTSVSTNTATVAANRFTASDNTDSLPTTDAAAFAVNDVVKLCSLNGAALASGATQVVSSISGNDITLDGNFGGALASGTVITYADRDDTTATQYNKYVHLADQATQTVGASTQTPWVWGET